MSNLSDFYKKQFKNLDEIYIFGTKKLALELFDKLASKGINIKGFIDNNKDIVGKKVSGLTVFSLDEINDKSSPIVIGTINYMSEIENQLRESGFLNIVPFSVLTLCYEQFRRYNGSYDGLFEDYVENQQEYNKVRLLFEDELSLAAFDALVEYRKAYDSAVFGKISREPSLQYLEEFVPKNVHVFVDGGAYDGDTTIAFKKFCPDYRKIYCFEPDVESFEKAKVNLKDTKNIEYFQCGLCDENKILKFDSGGGLGSQFNENGTVEVKCVKLDDVVSEDKAFIKFDIEGAEHDALMGAERLIKNGSILAICVYHKPSDLWKIPQLILSMNPSYKFYLRHYSKNIFETVLYGVPLDD